MGGDHDSPKANRQASACNNNQNYKLQNLFMDLSWQVHAYNAIV